jgi:hypothetical protein
MTSGESRDGGALRLGEQGGRSRGVWIAHCSAIFLLALCWPSGRQVGIAGASAVWGGSVQCALAMRTYYMTWNVQRFKTTPNHVNYP